ncbi:MAG TPA: dihydrofolate reductase family protein, partial [Pseudomonadota bacterium]|nr:dihydrofolate reductase family protein [Pseudomonadota bacterium]
RERGVEVLGLPPPSSRDVAPRSGPLPTSIDLYAALHCLGERELRLVLCEGGAMLHGALLDAGLYDEAALYLAPLFLGDDGVPLLRHFAVPAVSAAPWLTSMQVERLGQDLFISGLLRRGAFAPESLHPKEDGDVHRPG